MLLGCGTFVVVSTLVRGLTPWPSDYGLKTKFEYFAENKDDYSILFFGSSLVYRSVVPAVIEKEFLDRGIEARCFNFGNPGMRAFETDHLLKEALALRPANLKWVVVEARDWPDAIFGSHAWTKRAAHWHSTEQLLLALESVRISPDRWTDKAVNAIDHLLHWLWRQTAYGRGTDIVLSLADGDRAWNADEALAGLGGYRPLEEEKAEEFVGRHTSFLENQARFLRGVSTLKRALRRPGSLDGYNLGALESQVAAIRAAGAEPIYLIPPGPPGLVSEPAALGLLQEGHIPALLVYNDPVGYPRLYSIDFHFDSNHLNRDGAAYFSRILGRDLADLVLSRRRD